MLDLVRSVAGPILEGILRLIPDRNQRELAREQFETQILAALTGLVQGQLEVNKLEAQHGSVFVAGWRPAIGWICGAGVALNYIVQPLVSWGAFLAGVEGLDKFPELDISDLLVLLGGMLGLGGLRTYEKRLGVARAGIKLKGGQ